ncbi:CAF17-like 4Fe-4S cluster assembly/insertion protein YgfZ [Novosphingobium terrae]|uniref:CAF17-like 4Fe-4S cluster assembly/insertion protein YgfZ n=1 Tax=Novosphingobium terrae TaxID=2726189 RepID=UPI00197F3ADD|nr:folate-binding protein YgfZ [Novosphingobium terrae]
MSTLTTRALIRLTPQDPQENPRSFLQGLITSDVLMTPLPVWAGLLSPQGKALFDFFVWADGEDLLIDCEADQAEALAKRLSLYRLRRKIAIARDDTLAIHWSAQEPGHPASPDPRLHALGWRWLAPADDVAVDADYLAHRLLLGVTETHAELGDLLWLETNAAELNGVSFTKGCYVGQENTARMNWRQKVNRRLVVVPLEDSRDDRRRTAYPQLALAVDHRRVEDIQPIAVPSWLAPALQSEDAEVTPAPGS